MTVAPTDEKRPQHLHAPLPEKPLICICMTTYNPEEGVLRRQIESIRNQDYTNWICLVQDDWSSSSHYETIRKVIGNDPRFRLERNAGNLGFYLNFEKVLRRVPANAELVALSDQDDFWYRHKLSSLLAGFKTPDTMLVYSDTQIVDANGKLVSKTFWSTRRNNYTDFETLFFANTVTGAAAMFKAALLPLVLPFPLKLGHIYHDWWIALVAMAAGKIEYIDRPLYDYYQHSANAVGWSHISKTASPIHFLRSHAYRKQTAQTALGIYHTDCKFLATTIQTLRLRVPDSSHNGAINRLHHLIDRPLRTYVGQWLRSYAFNRATKHREKNFVMSHTVIRMLNVYFGRKHREIGQKFSTAEEAASSPGSQTPNKSVLPVETFEIKCRPLNLDIRDNEPKRVNVFLATIDFKYFFGGYIGMFQLAKHIAKAGFKTRFIILETTDVQPELWREQIQKYAGLEDTFDLVEVAYAADRSTPILTNPRDRYVATSCWSAWVADAAARQLNVGPFIFMIQEYEPYFVPHGSYYALSHAAYDLDLWGIFSTEILREFFQQRRFGIYRNGPEFGNARSISFHNAILNFKVDAARLRNRTTGKRKFLFYCRPEAHAQRNMFELGILALRRALADGALSPEHWDFYGIGTVGEQFVIPLADGVKMVALPKMSLKDYADYLPDFDLGMSLMYTPHPSLVPLEMAAAGLITVTNSCENKTEAKLKAISSNFEVGEATIQSLAAALRRAESRVYNLDARAAGAAINWPTSWEQAFAPDILLPLLKELGQPSTGAAPSQAETSAARH
jgi:hypothetical protein